MQTTIACQSRWGFRLAFHLPGNIRARYQEQPSGSVSASFEVLRHYPRTPLSRPVAVAPISQISDPATSSSCHPVKKGFPIIDRSCDGLAHGATRVLSRNHAKLVFRSPLDLRCTSTERSTTSMLQSGTLQVSFDNRCGEDIPYQMEGVPCFSNFVMHKTHDFKTANGQSGYAHRLFRFRGVSFLIWNSTYGCVYPMGINGAIFIGSQSRQMAHCCWSIVREHHQHPPYMRPT